MKQSISQTLLYFQWLSSWVQLVIENVSKKTLVQNLCLFLRLVKTILNIHKTAKPENTITLFHFRLALLNNMNLQPYSGWYSGFSDLIEPIPLIHH